jgi:hypothetical protein
MVKMMMAANPQMKAMLDNPEAMKAVRLQGMFRLTIRMFMSIFINVIYISLSNRHIYVYITYICIYMHICAYLDV